MERRASEIDVPNLDDEELALAGVSDFAGMCAGCHGAPGQEPEAMGQGLNPPAPDLAESAAHMTPAELLWVTKNGIKMTGMDLPLAAHDLQPAQTAPCAGLQPARGAHSAHGWRLSGPAETLQSRMPAHSAACAPHRRGAGCSDEVRGNIAGG